MPALRRDPDARRERTLLAALLLSLWAPLATGLAVLLSHSTTQLADFVRRSVELAALAISWSTFRHLRRRPELAAAERARLERRVAMAVALALAVSGGVMLLLAAARLRDFAPGGEVRPGLAIALLGFATNGWFWRRFTVLVRERPSRLIDAQRRLYRAKVSVDACVAAALAVVWLAPGNPATRWVDLGGSLVVAAYLWWSAVRTAWRPHRDAAGRADLAPG